MLFVKSQALALTGQLEELNRDAELATEASLLSTGKLMMSWAMTTRCQASLLSGDVHEAVRFGERGAAAAAVASSPLSGIARVQLAEALLEVGEPARCREELTSADGHPDLPPFPLYEARCFELLARAALALSDDEAADWFAKRAENTASRDRAEAPARARAPRPGGAAAAPRRPSGRGRRAALESAETAAAAGAVIDAARGRILAGKALAAAALEARRSRSSKPRASSSSPARPSTTATRPSASCGGSAAPSRGASRTPPRSTRSGSPTARSRSSSSSRRAARTARSPTSWCSACGRSTAMSRASSRSSA